MESPLQPSKKIPDGHNSEPNRKTKIALLLIHGIGQQQPFEPLDRFVNYLRQTLSSVAKRIEVTHHILGRGSVFDHRIALAAEDIQPEGDPAPGANKNLDLHLDLYEFYWAPLTQRKASFLDVVRWLARTGLTPLQRLAFNLPLIVQQARARVPGLRRNQFFMMLVRLFQSDNQKTDIAKFLGWVAVYFLAELVRLTWVPLAALVLAGLAYGIVNSGAALVQTLPALLGPTLPLRSVWDALSIIAFLSAVIAAVAIVLSLVQQPQDLWRARRLWLQSGPVSQTFTGIIGLIQRKWPQFRTDRLREEIWTTEVLPRAVFFALSILALPLLGWVLYRLLHYPALCVGSLLCMSTIVADIFQETSRSQLLNLAKVLGIIGIAWVLKRIFVDYAADVAVYTVVDENSPFMQVRRAILKEATRKLRWLLKQQDYDSVAIAGHSLGSVIGYDAINWLRVEAQAAVVKKGSVSPAELERLNTFITFGSPLNKVLYFFRAKVKASEKVRGHIVSELYSFRRPRELLNWDPSIKEGARQTFNRYEPPRLYWLNVYAPFDPISARLVFYEKVYEYRRWYKLPGLCHMSYWHDSKFYEEVLAALISGQPKRARLE